MNLQAFQKAVAARVRDIPLLAAVPVREEQVGNIIETLKADIDKTSLCVVVEDPEMNRAAPGRPTFLSAAQEIAKALKLFRPDVEGAGALTSPKIGEAIAVDDGVVAVTVTLTMKAEL